MFIINSLLILIQIHFQLQHDRGMGEILCLILIMLYCLLHLFINFCFTVNITNSPTTWNVKHAWLIWPMEDGDGIIVVVYG